MKKLTLYTGVGIVTVTAITGVLLTSDHPQPKKSATVIPITVKKDAPLNTDPTIPVTPQPSAPDPQNAPVSSPAPEPAPTTKPAPKPAQTAPVQPASTPEPAGQAPIIKDEGVYLPPGTTTLTLGVDGTFTAK